MSPAMLAGGISTCPAKSLCIKCFYVKMFLFKNYFDFDVKQKKGSARKNPIGCFLPTEKSEHPSRFDSNPGVYET
jgi:hypothetical protein